MPREISSTHFKIMFSDTSTGNDHATFGRYYPWIMNSSTWNNDGSISMLSTTKNNSGKYIETPFMDWHYWPEKMWNIIIRELILDTESLIQNRTSLTAMALGENAFGCFKGEREKRNPNTSSYIFNSLPGCLHELCKLKCYNNKAWKRINEFYSFARNNLLHWKQIINANKNVIQEIFELYFDIYVWIDDISVEIDFSPMNQDSVLYECFPEVWLRPA